MANTASTTLNGYKIEVEYRPGRGYEFTVYKPDGLGLVRAFSIGEAVRGLELAKQEAAAAGNTALVATLQSLINGFPAEATTLQALVPTAQPAPPASAGQTVNDDAVNNPNKPPPLQANPATGRITTPSATTEPSNAEPPNVGAASTGIDAPTKTLNTTQATYEGVSGGALPVPGSSTAAATANSVNTGQAGTPGTAGNTTTGTITGTGSVSAQAAVTPGVDTSNDDRPPARPDAVTVEVNNGFNKSTLIAPQPNILDRYASYTYNVSVYLTSPEQYRQLVTSKRRKINGYNLLFQSGGAPTNVGGAQGALGASQKATQADLEAEGIGFAPTNNAPGSTAADAGRSPFFPDDFYIDSVTIDNQFPGKQTGAAHMVTNMKFTVIEPSGITLIDRIYEAVQDFAPKDATGVINYTAAQYLMVVRWYGYDQSGKLVRPGATGKDGLSDPNAVCEKFIPFIIKKINWSVSNKLVSYDFECGPIGQQIGGTTARGSIPYDIELSDSTVEGLLGGDAKYGTGATTAASPGASTTTPTGNQSNNNQSDAETARLARQNAAAAGGRNANDSRRTDNATGGLNSVTGAALPSPAKANQAPTPKKTITAGLIGAMNKFQAELVEKNIYQYPDEYEIVFADGADKIKSATIVLPGKVKNQSSTPMTAAASTDAKGKDPARQRVDNNVRNFNVTAGQQILQAIDLTIRNSSFIYNQAAIQKSEKTVPDPAKDDAGTADENTNDNKTPAQTTLYWYLITMEAVPTNYDEKRNDYAYKIRYIISVYPIQNFNSKYYPIPKFLGLHKQYRYWFTGENSGVLDYQATFNHLYNMTVSGKEPNDNNLNRLRKKYTSSMRELTKYTYQAASSESRAGAESDANEVGANAGESLYSPSDLAKGKIKIIGDPAWIQQGSVAAGVNTSGFDTNGFLPDGTINFDSSQVMFAIEWQKPQDYDLKTGLADPYGKANKARKPINSYVYQAIKCVSEFRQGRFEQTIDGSLYYYPTENLKNTATTPSNAVADQTNGRPTNPASDPNTNIGAGTTQAPVGIDNTRPINDSPGTPPNSDAAVDNAQQSAPTSDGQNIGITGLPAPGFLEANGDVQSAFNPNADPNTNIGLDVTLDPTSVTIPSNQQIERDF